MRTSSNTSSHLSNYNYNLSSQYIITDISMEHHHFQWGFIHYFDWSFYVIFNSYVSHCQRVYIITDNNPYQIAGGYHLLVALTGKSIIKVHGSTVQQWFQQITS